MSDNTTYFVNQPANDRARIILQKSEDWYQSLQTSGYYEKLRTMWQAYHGVMFQNGESHTISFTGEQGELTQVAINHIRNIATNIINMITATRPAMQCRAVNTDYKSYVQTKLGNGLLDYYLRDHRLENYFKTAVEYAVVLASGYVKLAWNATAGEEVEWNDALNIPIHQGDMEFDNLSPFDVYFDVHREDGKHDWINCRTFKNRFDLAAKYPEFADDILALPTKDKLDRFMGLATTSDDTDLIPVFEFYHNRTDAVPEGLYHLFLSDTITLLESPLPYRRLPVYDIMPNRYLGTPFGYTQMFDLLGPQDAVNTLYSTILSNQTAFGVQNIAVQQGSNLNITELSGGLNVIEVDMRNGPGIQAINLTQTPKEIFDFIKMLESVMETISGVNPVTRGNPPASLTSGTALALVQSMSLQFISGLQQAYVAMQEDVGTGIINTLKDHASTKRVVAIVGKSNRTELREFTGDELSSINRVIVDIGNPLANTTAGKMEIAKDLLQMQAIKTYEQYMTVLTTGKLDDLMEDTVSELFLIKDENELLMDGNMVQAVMTDEHALHIKEHKVVLADPVLRRDPKIVQAVLTHIQEHIDLLKTTDPNVLMILGQQPIAPPMPPQGPPPPQGQPQGNAPAEAPAPLQMPTQAVQTGAEITNLPNLPQIPQEANLPNPELQAMNEANLAAMQNR